MYKIIKLISLGFFLLGQIPATFAATACGVVDSSLQGSFEGGCKEGKADGYGIASGTDRYEGDFALGRPHGKGSYIWSDGERYDGEFLNGRMTGKGAYKFKNGDRYEGEFADGMRSGRGKHYHASSGETEIGEWYNNKLIKKEDDNRTNQELQNLRNEINQLRGQNTDSQERADRERRQNAEAADRQRSNARSNCTSACSSERSACKTECENNYSDERPSFFGESPRSKCNSSCSSREDACRHRC